MNTVRYFILWKSLPTVDCVTMGNDQSLLPSKGRKSGPSASLPSCALKILPLHHVHYQILRNMASRYMNYNTRPLYCVSCVQLGDSCVVPAMHVRQKESADAHMRSSRVAAAAVAAGSRRGQDGGNQITGSLRQLQLAAERRPFVHTTDGHGGAFSQGVLDKCILPYRTATRNILQCNKISSLLNSNMLQGRGFCAGIT